MYYKSSAELLDNILASIKRYETPNMELVSDVIHEAKIQKIKALISTHINELNLAELISLQIQVIGSPHWAKPKKKV